jgi:hypothetical protein
LIRVGALPEDYDFEAHKELVLMQPGDVPVTSVDTSYWSVILALNRVQVCGTD